MKKRIGILFPIIKSGGIFQYALSLADSLINYSNKYNYSVLYYNSEKPKEFLKIRNPKTTQFVCLDSSSNNFAGKIKSLFNLLIGKNVFTINKNNKKILKDVNLDLLIIPFPFLLGFENKIPYLVCVPDIMHRYYPDFPEYSLMTRLKRDIVFKYSTKYSLLNIVDSQQGLEDLYKFYKTPKKKIRVLPFTPPGYIYKYKNMNSEEIAKTLKKYILPEKFLFYPAHFWHHKNHLRLVKALKLIAEKKGAKLPLVLVGDSDANKDNYQKVMSLARGLDVRHLGYVSDQEIVALYKKATALVFSSLIGPTNLPPLEAMVLGTPVLCSNLFSMPEQIGEAGILFNPFDIKDMAEKIYKIWTDEKLRKDLIQKGYQRVENLTLENYSKKWEQLIDEALQIIFEKKN